MSDDEVGAPMACPVPPTPGKWSWARSGSNWTLVTPTGLHAATVYSTLTWFVWDPEGEGGQNASGADLDDAKWQALHAAKAKWYEEGWIDPAYPTTFRQGSRIRLVDHDDPLNVAVVVEVYDGEALVCSVPEAERSPKWKYAVTGVVAFDKMTLLPPRDLPEVEDEAEEEEEAVRQ